MFSDVHRTWDVDEKVECASSCPARVCREPGLDLSWEGEGVQAGQLGDAAQPGYSGTSVSSGPCQGLECVGFGDTAGAGWPPANSLPAHRRRVMRTRQLGAPIWTSLHIS